MSRGQQSNPDKPFVQTIQVKEVIVEELHFSVHNGFLMQVVTNRDTQETLLCIAYVFEVSTSEHGAQHHIYRLVKDWC